MKKSFITFESDAPPVYHLNLIRQGVRDFIENQQKQFKYIPLSWNEIISIRESDSTEVAVVGWFRNDSTIHQLETRQIPYLNLFESPSPSNTGLNLAFAGEGTLAADFFIQQMGFENLAFAGLKNIASSNRRLTEYTQRAKAQGISIHNHTFRNKEISSPPEADKRFISLPKNEFLQHIRDTPKPLGIFCCNDRIALAVQHTALELGFSVPEDVSVIGVGGTNTTNSGETNGVSVIQLNHFNQGRVAASMLVNHLRGQSQPASQQLRPDGISHRETTINRNAADPLIQKAMTTIREDPAISIDVICQRLGTSRRTLEKRFRSATNTTLARTIDYERFNKAKMLIKSVDYNQESIAGLAGYANREQMRRSFLRFAKINPRQYQRDYLTNSNHSSRSNQSTIP